MAQLMGSDNLTTYTLPFEGKGIRKGVGGMRDYSDRVKYWMDSA